MEAYREIVPGKKVAEIMDLPETLKATDLEVLVFPAIEKEKELQPERPRSIKLDDLPRHRLGREIGPLDREHIYENER